MTKYMMLEQHKLAQLGQQDTKYTQQSDQANIS